MFNVKIPNISYIFLRFSFVPDIRTCAEDYFAIEQNLSDFQVTFLSKGLFWFGRKSSGRYFWLRFYINIEKVLLTL